MIKCDILNREFATKKEMFAALMAEKENILAMKKATIKYTDAINIPLISLGVLKEQPEQKRLSIGDTVSVVINTTNYLDNHGDVHINGLWTKSFNEQQGKIYHIVNHETNFDSIVGYPKDVQMQVVEMNWRQLGKDLDGTTQALIFNTKLTDKTNPDVFKAYRDNEPVQHSIRMGYVKILFAINDEDYKDEYANWNQYYNYIANKEKADEQGFFFAITEAKIMKEGSTVLFGSNDATPYLGSYVQPDSIEPVQTTQTEPTKTDNLLNMISSFDFVN